MTTLTVAERVAQIKQERANGKAPAATKEQGFWWQHTKDTILRKTSDILDTHEVRKEEASVLAQALRDKRIAEGCRW